MLVAQSCQTLCNPTDCSSSGSSVHGILRARILEKVAIPFSRDGSDSGIEPVFLALQVDSLPTEPPDHRRTVWRGLKTLKVELPCEPAIPLLGIYLKKTLI